MNFPTEIVSVIIPARDGLDRLRDLLATLDAHWPSSVQREVIVVDDGSQPPLAGAIACRDLQIRRLETSQGPALARNLGAHDSIGTILLFLDADVHYSEGAIEQALGILQQHPDIGAVSFLNQAFDPDDGLIANYGAAMEHYWLSALVTPGQIFGDCAGFTTRNGVVRRACFEAIHGFDTRYRTNAHEDYDFGKRLRAHTRTVIAASPLLHHAFPTRLRRVARNYWVRTSLFIPYMLKFRPPMDSTQVSSGEALVRLSAVAPLACLVAAAIPLPVPPSWRLLFLLGGAACLLGYAVAIRQFLAACRAWSGSRRFAAATFGLHYLVSLVILVGGGYGLLQHWRGKAPESLLSPIR